LIKDPWGKERAGFTVTGKINRSDWGLTWNTLMETGGLMVSDEVTILCEVELINEGQKKLIMELESEADKK
jgi:polyisoprenoid-binding protein YceI